MDRAGCTLGTPWGCSACEVFFLAPGNCNCAPPPSMNCLGLPQGQPIQAQTLPQVGTIKGPCRASRGDLTELLLRSASPEQPAFPLSCLSPRNLPISFSCLTLLLRNLRAGLWCGSQGPEGVGRGRTPSLAGKVPSSHRDSGPALKNTRSPNLSPLSCPFPVSVP